MCGIAGMLGSPAPTIEELTRMATEMAHRGPDDQGIWFGRGAGLAFRRLAIVDLDPRSNQPLKLGSLHLVFNGEIYNYRELREELRTLGHQFVTEGDGEVLLHAWQRWGEDALPRLNGMFAFAVFDERTASLTLACDPFGEKPLFWADSGERLMFASDVRALLSVEPSLAAPRQSALGPYLSRGIMPPICQSFFDKINRLAGGHVLRHSGERPVVERWWEPTLAEPPHRYDEAVAQLRELLTDSIRLRLRSDVPVGSSLSGGVDSGSIVSLAAQIAGDHTRHAFTARFPGFERDEWSLAAQTAEAAGVVTHHAVEPSADDLLEDLVALIVDHEEPVASSSVYAQYRVMRAARDAGITVLLDGQGADELFGGYTGAAGWALRSESPITALRALARGGGERRDVLLSFGSERVPRPVAVRHRIKLGSPYVDAEVLRAAAELEPPQVPWARHRGPLARELSRQVLHTSLPALLRYADRNSMANGREVRLPFLDPRVVNFALSLPPAFVYGEGVTKRVLRDAVSGLVPSAILERRDKVGFETPEATWLTTHRAKARIAAVLLDSGAISGPLLDRRTIEADTHAGRWRDANAIWRTVNLELWLQAFARPPSPTVHQPAARTF
jgi:asparagine synthase (glutamine-hydrolysing)